MEVGLGPGDFVLDGDPAPPKKGHTPNFWPMSYYGWMAGWIKMRLGAEVGLSQGDIVLDRNTAPPKRGTAPQIFGLCRGQTTKLPL